MKITEHDKKHTNEENNDCSIHIAESGSIHHTEEASEPSNELTGRLSCTNQHRVSS